VVLHELHVLQRDALAVRERHAVGRLDVPVRGEREDLAAAAGREEDGRREDQAQRALADVERSDAVHRAAVDDQLRHELLVVADDVRVAQRLLEERVQHVEADLVGGVPRALGAHAAEGARRDAAVVVAAPGAAPVLEQGQLLRRLADEVLDHVLVAEEVRPLHGVVGVHLEAVVGARDRGGAALGGDRVAPHRVDLRDERDARLGVLLGGGDGGAQSRGASTDDDEIVAGRVHRQGPHA
jgi:hypothetical protein